MDAKHTAGPWQVERAGGYVFDIYQEGEDSGPVAADCGEADARLIAAAPDLLAALQTMVDGYIECFGEEADDAPEPVKQARAAILKATGA